MLVYQFFIFVYSLALRIASLFSSKAKLWVEGRKNWEEKLKEQSFNQPLWFHCASLGEFEQARPVIESIKKREPKKNILVTFFSPSGYEERKEYPLAKVIYLPLDTINNAKNFISIVKPEAVFFVKYEFWFNYLAALLKSKVPTYLLSGVFRKDQLFFKPLFGKIFTKRLKAFTFFFLQNQNSANLLQSLGYQNFLVSGDTRFDRVNQTFEKLLIESRDVLKLNNDMVKVIIGSSWQPEEELMLSYLSDSLDKIQLIIVPHDIAETNIRRIKKLFSIHIPVLSTDCNSEEMINEKVVIVNEFGLLSKLYNNADITFVGGAFGKGLHNILEPATFGKPIIFGPKHKKFYEAQELIDIGGAFSVDGYEDLKLVMDKLIENKQYRNSVSKNSREFVEQNLGASDIVLKKYFHEY